MILNKPETSKLALMSYLIEQHKSISKEFLTDKFHISLSTLKRRIHSINDELKTIKEFHYIEILDQTNGYYWHNPTPFNDRYVLKKINLSYHLDSIQFQLFQKIFLGSNYTLPNLAKILSISLPYLYHLLFYANKFLAKFSIKIEYAKNLDKISISGSALTIRLFESYFFWSISQDIHWPFKSITVDELYSCFSEKELKNLFNFSLSKQSKYLYSLAVVHHLHFFEKEQLQLDSTFKEILVVFQETNNLSCPLEKLLTTHYQTEPDSQKLKNEYLFFNFISRLFDSYKDIEDIQIEIGEKLFILDNELITYCRQLIQSLSEKFPTIEALPNYFKLKFKLLYFLTLYLKDFMLINPNLNTMNSKAFKESKNFIDNFIKEKPLKNDQIISKFHSTLLYSQIYYVISNVIDDQLTIYIHFSKNMFGESYIEAELYKLFGKENIIIVPTIEEAQIVISDFYEYKYKNENYFYFEDIKDKKCWKELFSFVQEHRLNMMS
uniref:Mga helix-turn-helix domain-containing protein n=1 Tax=Candidatus Enterococcus mansonii TaxID=1834181 RepID=A0A242CHP7_9ENTE|nr:helix-turn-helix domain-containing protein [Enterococcus sp. 4G2_DIV0659]OTO09689.1 hypothetical protein A5880_000369 [Enterococcus sp. 4G2_DIV0659]